MRRISARSLAAVRFAIPLIEAMRSRGCFKAALELALKDAEIIEHRVGLRPGRREVRLEMEQVEENCAVIHNYGHGGAGFTPSF